MGKLFSFLIILGGLVGAYFVIIDHFADKRERGNPWIAQINEQVAKTKSDEDLSVVKEDADGRLWRILSLMYEAERGKYSMADTVNAAMGGVKPGEAKMIVEALLENYDTAKNFGVFEEPKNLLLMDQGLAPVATTQGWEDEKLALGHRLSPVLAPEAAHSLVNLVLMPEAYRNMHGVTASGFTTDTVRKWVAEKLITAESAQAIVEVISPPKIK